MSVSKGCIIMADVKLSRPASGQQFVIPSAPDARLVLDFPADQVSIDRPEGSSSLFFHFDDGASIELQNFYGAYNKEALPEFEIDGQLIAGTDFFEAFGPDLVPAAGPASAERGARYNEYSDMGLAEGVWHLNELDYRLAFDTPQTDDEWAYGVIDNLAPTLSTGGAPITLGLTETGWDGVSTASPAPVRTTGSFTVRDPDGDSLTATVTIGGKTVAVSLAGPTTVESDYGTLVITPSGRGSDVTFDFEYTLKEDPYSKADQLAQGEQVTDGIVISVNDGMGHTVNQPVNVVITGSNDAPDITGVVSDIGGADGHTVKDDGVFGRQGDQKTGTIGTDENAAIHTPGTEDGQMRLSVSGKILAQDPDSDAELTFGFVDKSGSALATGSELGMLPDGTTPITVTDVSESDGILVIETDYGTLTLVTTGADAGSYTFTLHKDADATNRLAENEEITLTLRPTVTDNHGATDGNAGVTRPDADGASSAVNDLVITIKGSNDLPTVESSSWTKTAPGSVTEDASVNTITGTITATDVDADEGATLRYGFNHNGTMVETLYVVPAGEADGKLTYALATEAPADGNYYGTLTITGSGASADYSFALNNGAPCTQALDDSSSKTGSGPDWSSLEVTVPVVVMDAVGGYAQENIHLTINGVNDAPVFTSADASHSVKESGVYAEGKRDGVLHSAENAATTDDSFTTGGSVAARDVDGHGASDTLTYGLVDEHGRQFGGTSGEGEAAIYVTAEYKDDAWTPSYSSDPATADAPGYLGKLVMGKDGNYTFTLKNDGIADSIAEGDKVDLAFTPAVHDGTEYNKAGEAPTIAITVNGSNDAPTITSHDSSLSVTEGAFGGAAGVASASGTVHGADVDKGDTLSYHLTLGGDTGTLDGAVLHSTLYVVSDGQGGVTLSADPVSGETYGKLVMGKDGTYTFTLDNDSPVVQKMTTDDKQTLDFNVAVVDDKGAYAHESVTLTINGANDAPYMLSQKGVGTVKDDGVYSAGGDSGPLNQDELNPVTNTDAADPAAGTYKQSVSGAVKAEDYEGDKLTYSLDNSGSFPASGVPDGYTASNSMAITNEYGTLYLKSDGSYTFVLNMDSPKVNALGEGKSASFSVPVSASDGNSSTTFANAITITVKGTNDAPVLGEPQWTKGSEITQDLNASATTRISGTVSATDVDSGDQAKLTFYFVGDDDSSVATRFYVGLDGSLTATKPSGDYLGELNMNSSGGKGTYTFTLNNASPTVQAMGETDTKDISFKVAVRDPQGAYDKQEGNVTFTIRGGDDPTFINTGDLNQDHKLIEAGVMPKSTVTDAEAREYKDSSVGVPTATGRIHATDTDARDQEELDKAPNTEGTKLHYIIKVDSGSHDLNERMAAAEADGKDSFTIETQFGSLTIMRDDAGGFKYEYAVDNTNPDVQKMNLGDKASDGFTVLVKDTVANKTVSEAPVKVTITGANDRPTLDADSLKGGTIEITENTDGKNLVGRVEVADVEQGIGNKGGHSDYEAVNKGFTFSLVTAKDALTADQIAGLKTDGNLEDEKLFNPGSDSPVLQGEYGRLTIDQATGEYRYERTADLTTLAEGKTVTDVFYVRVKDADGAYSEIKPIEITIHGKDNAGVLTNNSLTVTEDGVAGNVQGILNWKGGAEKLGANEDVSGGSSMSGKLGWHDVDQGDTYKADGYTYGNAAVSAGGTGAIPEMPEVERSGNTYAVKGYGTITVDANGNYAFTKSETDNGAFDALQAGQSITITIPVTLGKDTAGADITQNLVITIKGTNDAPVVTDLPEIKAGVDISDIDWTSSVLVDFIQKEAQNQLEYQKAHGGGWGNFDPNSWLIKAITAMNAEHPPYWLVAGYSKGDAGELINRTWYSEARAEKILDAIQQDSHASDALKDSMADYNTAVATDVSKTDWTSSAFEQFIKQEVQNQLDYQKAHGGGWNTFDPNSWLIKAIGSDLWLVEKYNDLGMDAWLATGTWFNADMAEKMLHAIADNQAATDALKKLIADKVSDTVIGEGIADTATVLDPATGDVSSYATDVDDAADSLKFFFVDKDGNVVQSHEGKYGTLVVQPNGQYTYVLNDNVAERVTETFEIYVRDPHNAVADKTIPVVITAKPIPGGGSGEGPGGGTGHDGMALTPGAAEVQEDGVLHVSGDMGDGTDLALRLTGYTSAGADDSASGLSARTIVTDYGTITLLPDGTYTYTLNNDSRAVQELTAHDTIEQTFTVRNGKGEESTITITIKGANDAPYVVSQGDTVALKEEDGGWTHTDPTGSFTVADIDAGETESLTPSAGKSFTDNGDGTYTVEGEKGGIFTITKGADGQFTYTYKAAEGNDSTNYRGIVEDTAKLTISNGDGAENRVTVDLKARLDYANDAPTLTGEDGKILLAEGSEHVVIEDGGAKMVATGKVQATDPDVDSSGRPDTLTYAIKDSPTGMLDYMEGGEKLGTLILGKDGTYEFHLNTSSEAVQSLGAGETKDISFTVVVSDGHGGTATAQLPITITGTNDAPVISLHNVDGSGAAGSGALRDLTHGDFDKDYTVGGELKFRDVDAKDTVQLSLGGKIDGHDLRGDDDTDPTHLDVWAVKDGSGWQQCAPGTEGAIKMGHMELDSAGGSGSGSTGYRFVGDKAALALINKGEKLDVTVSINADDGNGGETSADFAVSITGTNTIPTITTEPVDVNITDDGSTYTASGSIVAADADGDTLTYFVEKDGTALAGTDGTYVLDGYGVLTLGSDGNYVFTLNDAGKEKLEKLGLKNDGTPETEHIGTFTVVVQDQYGARAEQTLTLGLTGRNDAPVAAAVATVGLTLDSSLIPDADWGTGSHVFELATDADANDTLAYAHAGTNAVIEAGTSISGNFGTLTFSDNAGHLAYEYKLDTSHDNLVRLAEAHAAGQELKDSFGYTVSDNRGGNDSSSIDVGITFTAGSGNADATENQLIFGNNGSDDLHGGAGNDILSGGAGDDHLYGGAGDDYLFGGAGNDFLDGGEGNNHLYGGDGNDVLVFHQGDTIDGGAGTDILLVSDKEGEGLSIDDLFTNTSGIEVVVTGTDVNSLTNMGSLADKGITFNADNQVVLDHAKGWHVDTTASSGGHDVWTNDAGLVVTVKHEDEGDAAKNAMVTLTA